MIESITFAKPDAPPEKLIAGHAWTLPAIARMSRSRRISFAPGLNVLFGVNGSGKSTILNALAEWSGAAETGLSCITESHLSDTTGFSGHKSVERIAASVVHDGRPVVYGSANLKPGVRCNGEVSDDHMRLGLGTLFDMERASSGEQTIRSIRHALDVLEGRSPFPDAIDRRILPGRLNDVWEARLAIVENRHVRSGAEGPPTVILDEPDAHLSFVAQANLWAGLLGDREVAGCFQIIVATHSPFALCVPHANLIALSPELVEDTVAAVRHLGANIIPEGPIPSRRPAKRS